MEEDPNFQLFSSQNSDLDNEQLDEIEQKAQEKNTKRATEWGVKKSEKWCEKKNFSGSQNSNAWFNFTCYHPPRATPGTSPALRSRGWGIA